MYYRSMLIVIRRSPVDSGQTNLNASFVEQIDSTMFGTTYSHSIAIGGKKEMDQIMAALHLYVVIFLFHPIWPSQLFDTLRQNPSRKKYITLVSFLWWQCQKWWQQKNDSSCGSVVLGSSVPFCCGKKSPYGTPRAFPKCPWTFFFWETIHFKALSAMKIQEALDGFSCLDVLCVDPWTCACRVIEKMPTVIYLLKNTRETYALLYRIIFIGTPK